MTHFILRIYLMGLIILVPGRHGSDWLVILQNARDYQGHIHFPVLIWEKDNLVTATGDNGKDIQDKLKLRTMPQGLFLSGDNLVVSDTNDGWVSTIQGVSHPWLSYFTGLIPSGPEQLGDIGWIPHMSDICQGARVIDGDIIDNPNKASLAGILELKGISARLEVVSLSDFGDEIRSLTFRRPGEKFSLYACKQAGADIAAIDIPINQPTVKLTLTSFDGSSNKSVELKPAKGGSKIVEVLLGNLTPLDPSCAHLDDGSHFMAYYKLASPHLSFDEKMPFVGNKRLAIKQVEEDLPHVVKEVSGIGCTDKNNVKRDAKGQLLPDYPPPIKSGASRPICTMVVMDP